MFGYFSVENEPFFLCTGKYMCTGNSYTSDNVLLVNGEVVIASRSLVTMKFFKNIAFFHNERSLFQKGLKLKQLPMVIKCMVTAARCFWMIKIKQISALTECIVQRAELQVIEGIQ